MDVKVSFFFFLPEAFKVQGPEEKCLSLEHQNPSKTSEKMGYFDRVTVSLHILQSPFGQPSGDVPCASEDMACGY